MARVLFLKGVVSEVVSFGSAPPFAVNKERSWLVCYLFVLPSPAGLPTQCRLSKRLAGPVLLR